MTSQPRAGHLDVGWCGSLALRRWTTIALQRFLLAAHEKAMGIRSAKSVVPRVLRVNRLP